MQGVWVQSLVGELRSHMLRSVAKRFKKKKDGPSISPIKVGLPRRGEKSPNSGEGQEPESSGLSHQHGATQSFSVSFGNSLTLK